MKTKLSGKQIHHIALSTNSKTIKLYYSNEPKIVEWLKENNKFFDEYPANLTIYCESSKEKSEIEKSIKKIAKPV